MENDERDFMDAMFPQHEPSRYRRRRKLSPLRKKRGRLWNLRPFVTLSPRKRANAVVRLRNRIRMQNPLLGRRFWGGAEFIEPGRPWQYNQETQVYFCGTGRRVYWNAYIYTARKKFWEKVSELAREKARAMLSKEEQKQEFTITSVPIKYDTWGYPTLFEWVEKTYTYPQFGGLTYGEYEAKIEAEIIADEPPEVYESFKIDQQFEAGIGLYVVIDADCLTREVVERVIDRFFALGEADWQSDTPIPRDRLPHETEMEFLMTVPPEKR